MPQTVLITGANRGIGLEFARQYAEDGDTVIAYCRDPENAAALNALAAQHDGVTVLALEATDQESIEAAAQAVSAPVDILIHNAGIYGGKAQDLAAMDYAAFEETLAVNSVAPLRVIRAFLPHVRKAGRGSRIAAISSRMGSIAGASPNSYAYRASKAAVNMVMRLVALDVAQDGIIACPFHPGWVRTDMGGANADLDVKDSVDGMRKVIAGLTQEKSGRFWQYDGQELDW
jgi:NAD(P)-dependent dehydrogenase (short-subunit alcohol dehydrogenase family)